MNASRLWPIAVFVAIVVASLAVGIWLRVSLGPDWLAPDPTDHVTRPWPVEADCYSQMARVQRILNGQGLIQNHFAVENWPEGLVPSTTAIFDYIILLLYFPLWLFTKYPLDWAGALVSPALWVALVLFWTLFRSREFTLAGRAVLIMGASAMPAFLWATACGRPRHQSLILALMAIALTAEYERWQIELTPKRAWNVFAGIVWGLACWTSLFEPAIVLGCLILFNLIVRRRENIAFLASFGITSLVAFAIEGTHTLTASKLLISPPAEYYDILQRWLGVIAEIKPLDFHLAMQDLTLLLLLLPFIIWRIWATEAMKKTDLFMVLLTVLLIVLTIQHQRWIYYSSLAELFLLARYFQIAPTRWPHQLVLGLFLAGLVDAKMGELEDRAGMPPPLPSPQLALISKSITGEGGIMAPWWISPGLLYFSGKPIVSGSSHCGIAGITASAKFFTGTSWSDAELILQQHKVHWIVVWDDRHVYKGQQFIYPLLNTSLALLGEPEYNDDSDQANRTIAQLLIDDRYVPTSVRLRAVTPDLKLYEYVPQ